MVWRNIKKKNWYICNITNEASIIDIIDIESNSLIFLTHRSEIYIFPNFSLEHLWYNLIRFIFVKMNSFKVYKNKYFYFINSAMQTYKYWLYVSVRLLMNIYVYIIYDYLNAWTRDLVVCGRNLLY